MTRVSRSSEVSRALCMHAYLTCQEEAGVITETETESQVSSFSICLSIYLSIHLSIHICLCACARGVPIHPSYLPASISSFLISLVRHTRLSPPASCGLTSSRSGSTFLLPHLARHNRAPLFTSYYIMRSPDEGVTKTDEELHF